jgi:hypothetical protein
MAAGSIIVDLLMRTGSFESDTGRAEKRLKQLEKEAVAVGKAIGAAFLAVGAATAALVKSSINTMDNMAKLARSVGTTTESLSALTFAAKLSGVTQEELGASLAKLARTASEASMGSATAARGFDALGISVQGVDGKLKNTDVLLAEIAEGFSRMEDGATKTALAQDLFGRSGAKLISLLNGGEKGLKAFREEAERLGVVINTESAVAAELFNDNLTRLQTRVSGLGISIANELLPTLNELTNAFVGVEGGGTAMQTFANGIRVVLEAVIVLAANVVFVFKMVGLEIGAIAAQLAELPRAILTLDFSRFNAISEAVREDANRARQELDAFERRILRVAQLSVTTMGGENDTRRGRGTNRNAGFIGTPAAGTPQTPIVPTTPTVPRQSEADRYIQNLRRQLEATEDLTVQQTLLRDIELGRLGKVTEAQRLELVDIAKKIDLTKELEDATRKMAEVEEEQRAKRDAVIAEGKAVYDSTRTAIERLNIEEARLLDLYNKKAISWDTYTRAVFAANDALMEVKDTESELNDIADELGLTFTSAFEDAVVNGAKLSDVLRGIAQDLLRITTRKLVTEPLGDLFSGLAKSALGSIGGSFFGGAKAGGGDVIAGRSFLVGENGPERFIPRTSGTILPNSTTMNRGGDTNINIQIPVSAPKDRATALQFGRDVSRQLSLAQSRNG